MPVGNDRLNSAHREIAQGLAASEGDPGRSAAWAALRRNLIEADRQVRKAQRTLTLLYSDQSSIVHDIEELGKLQRAEIRVENRKLRMEKGYHA